MFHKHNLQTGFALLPSTADRQRSDSTLDSTNRSSSYSSLHSARPVCRVIRLGASRMSIRGFPTSVRSGADTCSRTTSVDPPALAYHFKNPSRNGATYAQMNPERFLARLCALVPPPGAHTVRYYGVLAPRHALRARIIPTAEATNTEPKQLSLFVLQGQLELAAIQARARQTAPRCSAASLCQPVLVRSNA